MVRLSIANAPFTPLIRLLCLPRRFCKPCLDAVPSRVITMKPPARKSTRKKTQRDYAGLNAGQEADPSRWLRMMEGKAIKKDPFRRMKGSDVGVEWLENDEGAMREPIVIESDEGLGMKMPPPAFTVSDVAETLGEDMPVEVIGTLCFVLPSRVLESSENVGSLMKLVVCLCHRCRNSV